MLILNVKYRLGLLVFDSGNITFNKLLKRMKGSKERPMKKKSEAPCAASALRGVMVDFSPKSPVFSNFLINNKSTEDRVYLCIALRP